MKEYKDVKVFTIVRRNWSRGKGSVHSCMLNNKGQRCCLGFYAKACGIPDAKMKDKTDPVSMIMTSPFDSTADILWKTFLIEGSNGKEDCADLTRHIIAMNDETRVTSERREKKLTKFFKRVGIKLLFVD